MITVCSTNFPMLFSKYFLIIYLIHINVYMLIPIPSIIPPVSGGQQALQIHRGGTLPATYPQLPQPQDTPSLGPKPVRLQGYDTSPAQYFLREIESEFLFHFFLFSSHHLNCGLKTSPEGEHGNPLQYSCLENPMDRGAWWATVHGVAQSQTRLSD